MKEEENQENVLSEKDVSRKRDQTVLCSLIVREGLSKTAVKC